MPPGQSVSRVARRPVVSVRSWKTCLRSCPERRLRVNIGEEGFEDFWKKMRMGPWMRRGSIAEI